jgi:hypothetical protein
MLAALSLFPLLYLRPIHVLLLLFFTNATFFLTPAGNKKVAALPLPSTIFKCFCYFFFTKAPVSTILYRCPHAITLLYFLLLLLPAAILA